ncbi:hypothetical protein LR004_03045 [Candidatus Gracilibacteria bacterium]|nr:hypothetical protein [Candidatus Gracilibacteria bacterium]
MKIEELKNKKIAILGFGKEGKSTLDFLLRIGSKDITVLDKNFINLDEDLYPNVLEISGEFYLDNLESFDVIIKSPGISPYHPKIQPYTNKLSSQAEIFFSNYLGKVIGVTATKGKTTTVSILYKILKNAGLKVKLVGNIGNPVLEEINLVAQEKYDYVIYELSSYMLEGFVPKLHIGVLGNIFPDHVDWHNNSLEIYTQAKLNILKNAEHTLDGREILKNKNNILQNIKTPLLGEHNIRNISLVNEICKIIGIPENILRDTVKTFQSIPHRLEKISEKNGIIFIDDAISTTPHSTIEAIKTFGKDIGTIFLGGLDRGGYSFEELVSYLKKYNISNIVLFPETGSQIKKLLNSDLNILETSAMQEAIKFAFQNCKKGEVCLLSTASPSYNLYRDYIEQGEDFKQQIINYK